MKGPLQLYALHGPMFLFLTVLAFRCPLSVYSQIDIGCGIKIVAVFVSEKNTLSRRQPTNPDLRSVLMWESSVHRSAVRSNASSKFLQDYAGKRLRQTRTPNTSAERVVANLIKLEHCRVKKTVSPSTPTCWRRTPSFRSRRNTISHRETQTQQPKNKTTRQRRRKRKKTKRDNVFPLSVCLMSS